MTWNHRVIFHRQKPASNSYYAVHECYYESPGDEIPTSWTVEPICLTEDSLDEMRVALTRIRKACSKPVLRVRGKKLVEVPP